MARKLPLKVVVMANGASGPAGVFHYGEQIREVLRWGPPGGLNLDEVIRCVNAQDPVEKAIEEKAEEVTLSEEQYRTLRDKLERYPFPLADRILADFGLAIRNAEEIT